MENFAENLNLGKRVLPPWRKLEYVILRHWKYACKIKIYAR